MRFSLNWLKEYVEIEMSPDELAHALTMAGLEVESVEPLGRSLNGKIIASKIVDIEKHPNADRLVICHMETGEGQVPVVCGAPNVRKGAIVPMARPGTLLPGGISIKESNIRGVKSAGMLLAEDELGLTDDHSGIMILSEDIEPGEDLASIISLSDHAFDISLTPNRPDCASIIGIAREVAAITGKEIKIPEIVIEEKGPDITDLTSVTIEDIHGCPRYAAGMIQGVKLKPSPFWLRYRLYVSGVRAINNVVDVSNYVLLETGQPLHTFDFDQLYDHRIVVSRAKAGDLFTTLDGQGRALNNEHLMICDGEKPVALAGIMGGINSEIADNSKDVLIESACFDPVTIRKGSKSLGLSTEASYRFERGIDIEGVEYALKRALMLMSDLADGTINKGIIDQYPEPFIPPIINLRIKKTNTFLGTDIPGKTISNFIKSLNMKVRSIDNDLLEVVPPSYRVDIQREIDLIEEVARLEGYDKIPVSYPMIRPSDETVISYVKFQNKISEIMAGLGFSDIITYSFISPDSADLLDAPDDSPLRSFVRLRNPLSSDQSVMRTSLLPGLFSTLKENVYHGETNLKLYEWGKVFISEKSENDLPRESIMLAGIMSGVYEPKIWNNVERKVDFFDIKGTVEVLLRSLGVKKIDFRKHEHPPGYNPDLYCGIFFSDTCIGQLGQISDKIIEYIDIKNKNIFIFEIDPEPLMEKMAGEAIKFESFSRFPFAIRDISIIVDRKIPSIVIKDIIKKEGGELIESVNLFDLYEGDKLDPSLKTLSFRICYRSKDSTLDGIDVNRLNETIMKKIMKSTGGRLKEG